MHDADELLWVLGSLSPILLEVLILFTRPTWLVFLPLWRVAERRVRLVRPKLEERAADYRGAARTTPPLPELTSRVDLGDSVLACDRVGIALRRPFELGRRNTWLMRIDVARSGDEISLVARQIFVPMTVVISGPLLGWHVSQGSVVASLGFTGILVVAYAVQLAFTSAQRQAASEHAFDELERQLREALESPRERR
ncbi:MAG: hypothetical protein U0353_26630 [Sandaracinus sp.]|jgi:hypothetical protein